MKRFGKAHARSCLAMVCAFQASCSALSPPAAAQPPIPLPAESVRQAPATQPAFQRVRFTVRASRGAASYRSASASGCGGRAVRRSGGTVRRDPYPGGGEPQPLGGRDGRGLGGGPGPLPPGDVPGRSAVRHHAGTGRSRPGAEQRLSLRGLPALPVARQVAPARRERRRRGQRRRPRRREHPAATRRDARDAFYEYYLVYRGLEVNAEALDILRSAAGRRTPLRKR